MFKPHQFDLLVVGIPAPFFRFLNHYHAKLRLFHLKQMPCYCYHTSVRSAFPLHQYTGAIRHTADRVVHIWNPCIRSYKQMLYQLVHIHTTLTWEHYCFDTHTHTHTHTHSNNVIITFNIQYLLCVPSDVLLVRMWPLCLLLFNSYNFSWQF